jgi:Antitoxin VbhA
MAADRITNAERAERQRWAEEAEHSAEMEGVQVTEQWRADAARYVAG